MDSNGKAVMLLENVKQRQKDAHPVEFPFSSCYNHRTMCYRSRKEFL